MTPKNLDALRASLAERLPDFAKPRLAQFEAMVRADATSQLRAQLDAANERNAALQVAAIDYWNAAYVKSPTGEAASDALIALFETDAVTHTLDLVGDE